MEIVEDKIFHFFIIIKQDGDRIFKVSCPLFKGCHSFKKTTDEALDTINEIIEMCLDDKNIRSILS
jgi:predicted RNase H-like HicB family nuclease